MRLREAIAIGLLAAFATGACSRLTFVKPDAKRRGYDQIAPDYQYGETREAKQRATARTQVSLAQQELRAGKLEQAEAAARAALKVDGKSADAYTVLAVVAGQRRQVAQAGDFYRKAVDLAPERGGLLNNYGAWLCAQGRAAESLEWFDRAARDARYAQVADALANAGACALRAGQIARVERDLRRALALDPGNAVALGTMAEDQYRQGRYLEARAFSERRLAAASATPQVLQLASQIEEKLGDHAAAARYAQRSRSEFPQETLPGQPSGRPGDNTQ